MKWLFLAFLLTSSVATAEPVTETGYRVEASFVSTAPIRVIWGVLTDYNHISEFVPTIVESSFTPPDILHQKVRGHFWFFSKTVPLDLRLKETLYNKIEFETITSSASFKIYQGAWELKEGDVVSISYTLLAAPNFFVPKNLLSGILKKETKRYIDSIQAEINRRWALSSEDILPNKIQEK